MAGLPVTPGRTAATGPGTLRWLPLAAALAASCAAPRVPPVQRWIESPPVVELAASDLLRVDCAKRIVFPADPPPVTVTRGVVIESLRAGLTVRGGDSAPRIELDEPLDARRIDAAVVTVSGVRRGKVRFSWRSDSAAPETASGSVELDRGSGPLRDRYLADWSAEALPQSYRLALEPTTAAGEIVTVGEICLGHASTAADEVDELARSAWRIALGGDSREALLVPPDGEVERRARLARRSPARLELAVGRISGRAGPARVEVTTKRDDGVRETLVERELSERELAAGWVPLEVDLAALGDAEPTFAVRVRPLAEDATFVAALASPQVRTVSPASRARPNIVLISIDTLRADHLSLYGYQRPTSPRLDAWARARGVVFRRVVAPSGWTLPSHFSLFTGLDAHRHLANYSRNAIDVSSYRFLAEQLRRAGYRTAAITGGGFVSPDFGLAPGFESFRSWQRRAHREEELESNLEEVGRFLDRAGDAPFFLFLHTYEVHTPNPPRQPYFSRFSDLPDDRVSEIVQDPADAAAGFLGSHHAASRSREPGSAAEALPPELANLPVDAYDSAVAFTDERLGALLDRLSRPPFDADTVVALVSDHGETLSPTGRAGHGYLSADNLLVPMIVSVPGRAPRVVEPQVRLLDLFPTLLELAGAEVPDGIDGRSLRRALDGEPEPGRVAYAYAASTNYGLARIAPDGYKLEWANSPWSPLAGGVRWFEPNGTGESLLDGPPAGVDAAGDVRELQHLYEASIPGLRLVLGVEGETATGVEIESELIDPVSLKTPDVDMAGLSWLDVGRVRATLEPGHPLRLQFERVPGRELGFAVRSTDGACRAGEPLSVAGAAADFRQSRTWRLVASSCAGAKDRTVVVRARWQGPVPTGALAASDERVETDLRALGYLN